MQELIKYDLSAPEKIAGLAKNLQDFAKQCGLTSNIKGKVYPLVESWQWCGSQLGLYPILTSTRDLSKEGEVKYEATVEVRRISNDQIMSRGVAICSNKEGSKRSFDEYAILSMAQTRAEGKAFRMLLSWLMKAAGFEATPAEEMDFAKEPDFSDVPDESERQLLRNLVYTSNLNADEKEQAMAAIDLCSDFKRYDQIKFRLENRQQSIDEIPNPSQNDINRHLKATVQ